MKNYFFLSFAVLLLICSCKKKANEFNEPITIKMTEQIEYGGFRRFVLECNTVRNFPGGSVIEGTFGRDGNNITLGFSNVLIPASSYYGGPGSASRQLDLGLLANGNYPITINNGKNQSAGTLTVTDESYSVSFTTLNNVSFSYDRLMRIPANTIWGSVYYRDASQMPIVSSFINILVSYGAAPVTVPDGNYGSFRIESGRVAVEMDKYITDKYPSFRDFIYNVSGAASNLDSVVNRLSQFGWQHADSANFYIRSSNGSYYNIPGPPVYVL